MEFNAIKVHAVGTQVDAIIPLCSLELMCLVHNGETVMHLASNSARVRPNACCDISQVAASCTVISKEDYEILTDVLFKFKQSPFKFEGHRVLTREDWHEIISQPDEDLLTIEAESAISTQGQDAEIKFRDVNGDMHRVKFSSAKPWTERRELMPKDWDPEYWIRTTDAPDPLLSRENSVRVPYTEYRRVTDLVIKLRGHPADAQRAANGGVLRYDSVVEFVDANDVKQCGKLGEINVRYTGGIEGRSGFFYVYLGQATDAMTTNNSIMVHKSEANRLRSMIVELC